MSDSDLSGPAIIALNTLKDHPHLNTPEAIDSGPYGIQQIDAAEILEGLEEAAVCDPPRVVNNGGVWTLVRTS
jgi:hypothetical protein